MNNKYIYTFGGYDGSHRLNIIEKYDVMKDKWQVMKMKLPNPLSNCACFHTEDNNIILLGGGHSKGFTKKVLKFQMNKERIIECCDMVTGKDLRNKIIAYNGEAFAFGGNTASGEKLNLQKD